MSLAEEGAQTRLSYTAQAHVGGRLAQVCNRLVDSAALKLADEFFARFEPLVATPAPAAADETPRGEEAAISEPVNDSPPASTGVRIAIALAAAAVAAAAILMLR